MSDRQGEQTYYIRRGHKKPFVVRYVGTPPCLWCGKPVEQPSMDGPLVCPSCDMGYGANGPWNWMERRERDRHFRARIEEISQLPENRAILEEEEKSP